MVNTPQVCTQWQKMGTVAQLDGRGRVECVEASVRSDL